MLKLSVRLEGFDRVDQMLGNLGKQQRFAASRALNEGAYAGKVATEREISAVFDRPTPWIQKSVRYVKSTRDNLTSKVDFEAWGNKAGVTAEKVLRAEIDGGARKLKRFEVALARRGILPPGMAIVPSSAVKRDPYGNVPGSLLVQILAYFRAFGEQGYRANMTDDGRRKLAMDNEKKGTRGFVYFALQRSHGRLIPGIYQRFQFGFGSSVKPVLFFVKVPRYRPRLAFYKVGEAAALEAFRRSYPRFLAEAMRTAR